MLVVWLRGSTPRLIFCSILSYLPALATDQTLMLRTTHVCGRWPDIGNEWMPSCSASGVLVGSPSLSTSPGPRIRMSAKARHRLWLTLCEAILYCIVHRVLHATWSASRSTVEHLSVCINYLLQIFNNGVCPKNLLPLEAPIVFKSLSLFLASGRERYMPS